ncbi:MAG: hypothetical protein WCA77_02965 [Thermoplasmata archaeon]
MSDAAWPVDPGLLSRFRRAGSAIQWRVAGRAQRTKGRSSPMDVGTIRVAHLNDEEARVVVRSVAGAREVITDSGPLGALVLVLEVDERGIPGSLTQHSARDVAGFDAGAIRARWSLAAKGEKGAVPLSDIVALARYALA